MLNEIKEVDLSMRVPTIPPLVSIVIPTMTFSLVQKCIQSLITYTDLDNVEIIVVANGADPKLSDYISELAIEKLIDIRCIWFDKPLGAVIALNEGIKESQGEYVLLLNDDCEILWSEKNFWLNSLIVPFANPKMGCTGPFRMIPILGECGELSLSQEDIIYGFILFFCA